MLALQILIDGFAISSLYALGAIGFTLIFGVSGVLNLSHGAIMVVAAVIAWWVAGDVRRRSLLAARWPASPPASPAAFITYRRDRAPDPATRRAIPHEEKEIFVLTGTLLWGIMMQEAVAYFFTDNPEDGASAGRGRGDDPGRAHPAATRSSPPRCPGPRSACCGCWSTAPAPASACSPPR